MAKKKLTPKTKKKTGRKPIFKTVEALQKKIDKYWAECLEKEERPLITGVAYHCGFESRQSFYDYEKKEVFSYTIKRARLFIEMEYEKRIGEGAGYIFGLKNLGWTDKQEIVGAGGGPLIQTIERVIVKKETTD